MPRRTQNELFHRHPANPILTVESWINHFAGNERRGKILSLYMIVQLVGTVLGQLLLNIADVRGFVLFVVISVLLSLGSVPILLVTTQEPRIHSTSTLNVRSLFQVALADFLAPTGLTRAGQNLFAESGLSGR